MILIIPELQLKMQNNNNQIVNMVNDDDDTAEDDENYDHNDIDYQSCKMLQIWQIYLCKNIGRLG